MRKDISDQIHPALASSYEQLSPTHYIFHLRPSTWSDGSPLKASHFEEAWKLAIQKSCCAPLANLLFVVKNGQRIYSGELDSSSLGITALDDATLEIFLEKPAPFFLELLAFPLFFPKCANKTNGPFQLKEWQPTEKLVLEKNPHYWNADCVEVERLNFSMITDATTEHFLFNNKELCWLGQPLSHTLPPEELQALAGKVRHLQIDGTFWVICNTSKKPLNDLRLRRALSLCINREEMITHLLGGSQLPASSPIPPAMSPCAKHISNFNVQEAKHLFAQFMEEQTEPLKLTLNFIPGERTKRIAQYLQQVWQKTLPLTIQLEVLEKQLLNSRERAGSCELSLGEWLADFHHPYAIFYLFEEAKSYLNTCHWDDSIFREELSLGLSSMDPEQQNEHLVKAEMRMIEQLPVLPLFHHSFDYIKEEGIEDVVLMPQGCIDFSRAHRRHR